MMRDMLINKTTYNILTTFSLAASAFFMRLSGKTSTVFSGLAAASYGGYLLAKNYQVRQQNDAQRAQNDTLRLFLEQRQLPPGVERPEVPAALAPPNEFGITGAAVDWIIPAVSGLIFTGLPLVNLALSEKDSTATALYLGFGVLGGLCLLCQHRGASNLRRFNEDLEARHATMVSLL